MKEAYFDPALQKPLDVIEADILFEAMNLPMRKFERDAVGTESVVPDTEKVTTSALGVGDVQPARLEKCNLLFHRQRRLSEMNFSQNFPQEARGLSPGRNAGFRNFFNLGPNAAKPCT